MPLHLVGETIDKTRSHYLADSGRLVQLMRGIYVEPGDDAEALVLSHAVRIARYLYPRAYLAAASAAALGPTGDGHLYLSDRRAQRTRIRSLEIVRNIAPPHPSLSDAVVADSLGEFSVKASSMRQRFLEAFRVRSEHAASIDAPMRDAIAERLIAEYGNPRAASDAIWALARENAWYREGEGAERFLLRGPLATPARNLAAVDLTVAWHGTPIGRLSNDGFEWRWNQTEVDMPPLIRQKVPGQLPPFIVSLLPEGWLESVLKNRDERAKLRSGTRYMSNITIVSEPSELATLPRDVLTTPLERFFADGLFTGHYTGPGRSELEGTFERNLAKIFASPDTPRLSGVQIKAPMFLDAAGQLSPSTGTPFTHILKPAGTGGFEALPLIEWTALSLGRSAGFDVPTFALVDMPEDLPPALLVERFDIRHAGADTRLIAMEDLCSVLDLPPAAKYDCTIERAAHAVRSLSTSPDEDVLMLVRRALFAWLIADGDMHLKNLALLKTAKPGERHFAAVRFAPLYDAVTTRVFPGLGSDRMALKLNGKDERLRRADFQSLARTVGLRAAQGNQAIEAMVSRLHVAVDELVIPPFPPNAPRRNDACDQMLDLCRERLVAFEKG